MGALTPARLRTQEPILVVEILNGAYRWGLSTEPVSVLDADSREHRFLGGLDRAELEEAIAFLDVMEADASLVLDSVTLDGITAAWAAGFDLSDARAEVAWHIPGETWEQRRSLLIGRCTEPIINDDDEVATTIATEVQEDRGLLPPPNLVIDATSWPDHADNCEGKAYPIPFGAAGIYTDEDGSAETCGGSPAYMVDANNIPPIWLVSWAPALAAQCTLQNDDDGSSVLAAISTSTDGRGYPCATVSPSSGITADAANAYSVSWPNNSATYRDNGVAGLNHAGDLLLWLMRRMTRRVDWGRTRAVATRLSAFAVGGAIEEPINPWDYLVEALLPLLPVSVRQGGNGLYPIFWNWQATAADALVALEARPGLLIREGGAVTEGSLIAEFSIRYAFDRGSGDYRRTAYLRGGPGEQGNVAVHAAYSRHIVRHQLDDYIPPPPAEQIDADIVYSDATAALILAWRSAAYALPSARLVYDADRSLGWLEPGAVVTLTDSEMGLSGRLALIESVSWWAGALDLQLYLRLIPDLARDR